MARTSKLFSEGDGPNCAKIWRELTTEHHHRCTKLNTLV